MKFLIVNDIKTEIQIEIGCQIIAVKLCDLLISFNDGYNLYNFSYCLVSISVLSFSYLLCIKFLNPYLTI